MVRTEKGAQWPYAKFAGNSNKPFLSEVYHAVRDKYYSL